MAAKSRPAYERVPERDEDLLAECRVDTFRAGGRGGQHQNTTESGVRLVHRPTGVRTESRRERSQHRNKAIALERLRTKLEARLQSDPERVPTKVPKRERRRRLENKRRRGALKKLRRKPRVDED